MKKGKGKSKGNAFENRIARQLSKWLTDGEDKTQLISTRLSGGWKVKATGTEGWRQVGDIAPNGEAGEKFRRKFAVECKHRNKELLWGVFTQTPGENVIGWWDALVEECKPYDLLPLLIFRQNNRPIMIAADSALILRASDGAAMFLHWGEDPLCGIMPLTEFLETAPPAEVYRWITPPDPGYATH